MTIHFITHFDKNYLAQGLTMVSSLRRFYDSQLVRVLCLDDDVLFSEHDVPWHSWCLEHIGGFYPKILQARNNRSYRSWCWTLEPAWCLFNLNPSITNDGDIVVYCDSDMWWISDPIPTILSVMERADVALSPHHFPAGQESRERTVGKFNFGVSVMRACDLTRRIVGEWLDQTLERCDEFGAGDQKYLDEWPEKLGDRLAELPEGWNVGPWRLPRTAIGTGESSIEGALYVDCINKYSGQKNWFTELISFHFHEMRRGIGRNPVTIKSESWNLTNYEIDPETRKDVYEPYIEALSKFL